MFSLLFVRMRTDLKRLGTFRADLSLVPFHNPRWVETYKSGGLAGSSWEGVVSLCYLRLAQFIPLFHRFLAIGFFVLSCTKVEGVKTCARFDCSNSVEVLDFYV